MPRVYDGVGLLERDKLVAGRPVRQRGDEVDVALAVDVLAEADAASQIEAGDQLRRTAVDLAEPTSQTVRTGSGSVTLESLVEEVQDPIHRDLLPVHGEVECPSPQLDHDEAVAELGGERVETGARRPCRSRSADQAPGSPPPPAPAWQSRSAGLRFRSATAGLPTGKGNAGWADARAPRPTRRPSSPARTRR